jgi:hypothetical protein
MTSNEALATGYLIGLVLRDTDAMMSRASPNMDADGNYLQSFRVRFGNAVMNVEVREVLAPVAVEDPAHGSEG